MEKMKDIVHMDRMGGRSVSFVYLCVTWVIQKQLQLVVKN